MYLWADYALIVQQKTKCKCPNCVLIIADVTIQSMYICVHVHVHVCVRQTISYVTATNDVMQNARTHYKTQPQVHDFMVLV